ncbi:uncharacterized protein LOC123963354 isoform X1 [Micropterus dolomieu]|uniref:uncharacterized protein LOC123963354 isoform X1 n=1 Tax=Micropterus dolomieu TaxID=147949 RepID=UPI001E8E8BD3|nr:uncharacterized protein LOC123963354 isoform X1 [Micropterus dolomieu]
MSLKALETKWKSVLNSILEELTESQFRKLLFNLEKIPQGVKSGKVREEMPQIIIQYFGTEASIALIDKEMRQIPRMDARVQDLLQPMVDRLKKQRQKNKGATGKLACSSGTVAKRQKPAAVATSKLAADSAAKRQKLAAVPQKSCQPAKVDAAKPKRKKADSSLKPSGSTKTSKVQSGAAQPGKMKPAGLKKASKKNAHLEELDFNFLF